MTEKLGWVGLPACPGSARASVPHGGPISPGRIHELFGDTDGVFDDENRDPSEVGIAGFSISGSLSATFSIFVLTDVLSMSTVSQSRGHFLVRPVPEPSTVLLLASGLATLAVGRGRRAR